LLFLRLLGSLFLAILLRLRIRILQLECRCVENPTVIQLNRSGFRAMDVRLVRRVLDF
jgi:hypothetical protein